MTAQRWKKNNTTKVWRVAAPEEPNKWQVKAQEFIEEAARRKAAKTDVISIYDKLYDFVVLNNPNGTQTVVHNVYKTDKNKR